MLRVGKEDRGQCLVQVPSPRAPAEAVRRTARPTMEAVIFSVSHPGAKADLCAADGKKYSENVSFGM